MVLALKTVEKAGKSVTKDRWTGSSAGTISTSMKASSGQYMRGY